MRTDTPIEFESNCSNTVWPFVKCCSGFGQCINNSCQCGFGVVPQNDFVLVSGSCLTNYWSRFGISVLLGLLCVVPMYVGFRRTVFPRPAIEFKPSAKTLLFCTFLQYSFQLAVCIMAAANFWVLSSTVFTFLFLFQHIASSMAGTVWSLFVFKINYKQFTRGNQYKNIKLMYIAAAIINSVLSAVVVLCAHFLPDSIFRQFCIRSIAGLYSSLVCFWGIAGYYQMKTVLQTLASVNDPKQKAAVQSSLNSLIYGCLVLGSAGAIGVVVPHWYFHLYLVIKIAGACNITFWIYSFEKTAAVPRNQPLNTDSFSTERSGLVVKETSTITEVLSYS